MTYAKLIDGSLTYAPKVLRVDGKTIINPNGKTLEQYGYLPLGESIMPMADEGCEVVAVGYEVKDGAIVRTWEQVAKPIPTYADVQALRAAAYRDRCDPISNEITRLTVIGAPEDRIADARARLIAASDAINTEFPYPLEA